MKRILYLIMACMAWSCGGNSSQSTETETDNLADATELPAHDLPLPAIPDSIKEPGLRADYLLLHFWDVMDFNDNKMLSDTLLLEQTFSNFIYLLPNASGLDGLQTAVGRLAERAAANPAATQRIAEIADDYLYSIDSPFQSETLYKIYLQEMLKHNPADAPRYQSILAQLKQNEPGTVAPDFRFGSTSLGKVVSESQYTMLVLHYGPDTSALKEIEAIGEDQKLAKHVADGTIRVIAVDLSGSGHGMSLPKGWIDANTPDKIENMYVIRRNPSIYLIDKDRKVVLKDTAYPLVASKL